MKQILIGLLLGLFVVGCADFATNVFRTEQTAVNLAYTTYIGYTNGLYSGAIKVTPDQSNNIKGLRLKFAASVKALEGWRAAYETNSAVKPYVQAALDALTTDSDNLINAVNQIEK